MPTYLLTLDDALLVHVLSFATARDVEAITVASRLMAMHLLPQYPQIWRVQFVRQWEKLNFHLDDVNEDGRNLLVDPRLRGLFPLIVPLNEKKTEGQHDIATAFAFDGKRFGNDRSVRANVPFPSSFYVAVFKQRVLGVSGNKQSFIYRIGATSSGYFEINIVDPVSRPSPHPTRNGRVEMTAIGLVRSNFPLVGKQPGWALPSFGYHGDNGKLYSAFPSPYLPGAGCYIPCEEGNDWFPAVGLDSPNTIHVNFGQQPFRYDHLIDELFNECTGKNAVVVRQMLQNPNKVRSHDVRRTCIESIDAFIADVLERCHPTTTA
eukprot:jgi/Phyca11/4467/fgenesh1_pm.PHYCAscaffold_2_\